MIPNRLVASHRSMTFLLFRILEMWNRELGSRGGTTGPRIYRDPGTIYLYLNIFYMIANIIYQGPLFIQII